MKLPSRKCAHCKRPFKPRIKTQLYHSKECKNSAGQARLRDRAKRTTELEAEQTGALGVSNGA